MKKNAYGLSSGLCIALALTTGACVDHDYDLTEDIDKTINVGGESFTIPTSSTDVIRLTQILDLDQNSSIREALQGEYGLSEGDYVLVQKGETTHSDFHIGNVTINDPSHNTAYSDEMDFVYAGINEVTSTINPTVNTITLRNDNVTSDLVSASQVDTDVEIHFSLSYTSSTNFSGTAYIEPGYTAAFDAGWHLEVDPASASFIRMAEHNVIEFTERVAVTKTAPLAITLKLTEVDLTEVPEGQGLYKRGHFFLESSITSRGDITIENWNNAPTGTVEKLQLVTSTDLVSATITAITGVVDPKITINDTQFTINDIPDFLSDDENSPDVANPRFYVTVTNNSPVEIELNAQLASFSNDAPGSAFATANIGAAYGTAPVIIGANGTTEILISQEAVTGVSGTNIVVPGLSELIKTIPDFMRFQNVDCHAVQKEFTIALAPTYDFTTDYEAVIPLSFGADMRLHYTHEDTDWDTEDLDKFSFSKVRLSFNAINTIPLTMTPDVIALDRQGNEISDIKASVSGQVAAGSINAPSTSSVEVILTSTASNLSQVDGIRFVFDAVSDPSHVGYNLNSAQSLRFTDIKAEIIGGLTIDLN